jgi:N-methylhydantoinase B
VLRHRLWQINDEQGRTIVHVSGSPVASESNDFNVAIADAEGNLVCIGCYVLVHVAALSTLIQNCLSLIGAANIAPGDMYLCNDPWLGAVHQNDVCILAPIHWQGKLVAWTGSIVHQVDVGGNEPGSWNPRARDTFQEAVRYRFLRIVHGGQVDPGVLATYLTNSRTPQQVELDVRAQIAAANVAKERILDLFQRYGAETVLTVMQDMLDYSDILFRRKLRSIPDGRWYVEDYLDHDGHEERIYVTRLTLIKEGERLIFDYREADDQAPGFVNVCRPCTMADAFAATLVYLCNDIPWNQGVLRNVEVLTRPGSILDALFPAPVSSGVVNAGWTAANAACAALGRMLSCSPQHWQNLMAVWSGSTFVYNVFGKNQWGEPFGTMLINSALTGGGGRYVGDGYDFSGQLTTPRSTTSNVESVEARFPLLYLYRRRARDSGGPGWHRGGMSAESALTPYDTDSLRVTVNTLGSDHSSTAGLCGGYPGGGSNARVVRRSDIWVQLKEGAWPLSITELRGHLEMLPPKHTFTLQFGDVFVTTPHGGGGLGDPLLRDPEAVARDVRRGFVSPERARQCYGVIVGPDGSVDLEATTRERHLLRAQRLGDGTPQVGQAVGPQGLVPGGSFLALGVAVRVEEGLARCAVCDGVLGPAAQGFKGYCVQRQVELGQAGPWLAMRWQGQSGRFCLVEYVCPYCGSLLDCEERRRSSGPLVPWEHRVLL